MFEKSESTTERNNRRRNTVWYQTPFSKNVKRNIAEQFFYLLDKYFGKNHKYFKTFNINNVKVGYSCLALRKKCPCSELFWSAFFPHFPAFGVNTRKYGKNKDQNNSKYGHFLRRANATGYLFWVCLALNNASSFGITVRLINKCYKILLLCFIQSFHTSNFSGQQLANIWWTLFCCLLNISSSFL